MEKGLTMKKDTLGTVALLGAGIMAGILTFSDLLFRFACQRNLPKHCPHRKKTEDDHGMGKYGELMKGGANWFRSMGYKEVVIESGDGLRLTGYFLKKPKAKQTILCVHGYRGHGIEDFGYIARFYYKHDSNILIIDQRANKKSEGNYITFGAKECKDVAQWAWKIHDDIAPNIPIILDGVSMGATSVLLATGEFLPKNVKGVIADCGFTSAKEEIEYVARKMFHLPKYPFVPLIEFLCHRRAGFTFEDTKVKNILKHNKLPILFVHGGRDDFVPTVMSAKNYIACKSKKYLEIVEDAKHAMSYMVEEKRCQKLLLKFIDECLKK